MSFGQQPIANGFLTPDQFGSEYFFEMEVAFCSKCSMLQLVNQPAPEQMFHDQYAFFSSTSSRMAAHFQEYAEHVMRDFLPKEGDPFVVEIGSNDGIMLRHFQAAGIRHLGVEPSQNVAEVARGQGINSVSRFFGEDYAKEIVAEYGQADAYFAANVMCHIPTFNSVIAGIKTLLKPTGVALFEDPYLGDVVEKTSYDQLYDEHVFLFSLSSISYAFGRHGLEVFDVEPQHTHGGSMRYVIGHKGAHPISDAVTRLAAREADLGLKDPATYDRFRKNCERSRDDLMAALQSLRTQGKRVAGYAATSKSTTVTNYCGITPDLVEYISDTTPIKQGKFSPGVHIPVRPYNEFAARYPDVALLFGWNHKDEIFAKEEEFKRSGGKWLVYVPKVEVL